MRLNLVMHNVILFHLMNLFSVRKNMLSRVHERVYMFLIFKLLTI